jgi:hypothetical protein
MHRVRDVILFGDAVDKRTAKGNKPHLNKPHKLSVRVVNEYVSDGGRVQQESI